MYVHLENCLELYQIIFTNSNSTAFGKLRVNHNLLHLYRPGKEQNRAQWSKIIYEVAFDIFNDFFFEITFDIEN